MKLGIRGAAVLIIEGLLTLAGMPFYAVGWVIGFVLGSLWYGIETGFSLIERD